MLHACHASHYRLPATSTARLDLDSIDNAYYRSIYIPRLYTGHRLYKQRKHRNTSQCVRIFATMPILTSIWNCVVCVYCIVCTRWWKNTRVAEEEKLVKRRRARAAAAVDLIQNLSLAYGITLGTIRRDQVILNFESPEEETVDMNVVTECVACRVNHATRVLIPCGHQCICSACLLQLPLDDSGYQICPTCRGVIEDSIRPFASGVPIV
jgi:hypothetical protein